MASFLINRGGVQWGNYTQKKVTVQILMDLTAYAHDISYCKKVHKIKNTTVYKKNPYIYIMVQNGQGLLFINSNPTLKRNYWSL